MPTFRWFTLAVLAPALAMAADDVPTPAGAPVIHSARVFGLRPGSPALFQIAATGDRPIRFHALDLPPGLTVDESTGRLGGTTTATGRHPVQITAGNAAGTMTCTLEVVVGEDLCLTPPMGWNSWYCMSESVDQAGVLAMAEAFVASGLADHGWTYVNIDDCWQGARGGTFGALQGNTRFPDLGDLCTKVHALGLKVGIYSTPWMGSYAGFPGGSCWNAAGDYQDRALPEDKRLQPAQVFGRYPQAKKLGLNAVGEHWFADADARQWAAWGIDYVKYDWNPVDAPTTARLAAGLRTCGRDIVLSLSNNLALRDAPKVTPLAQAWRTTGDIHDSWGSIRDIGFAQDRWHDFARPGHWNDPDMLQVGVIGTPNRPNATGHATKLTPDEQRTQVSLWALLAAPLLLSCDVRRLDDFTRDLLTNDALIAIDQDPLGIPGARLASSSATAQVWSRPLRAVVQHRRVATGPDGRTLVHREEQVRAPAAQDLAVGLFNLADQPQEISASLADLKRSGTQVAEAVWNAGAATEITDRITATVPPHGCVLLRLRAKD